MAAAFFVERKRLVVVMATTRKTVAVLAITGLDARFYPQAFAFSHDCLVVVMANRTMGLVTTGFDARSHSHSLGLILPLWLILRVFAFHNNLLLI